MPIFKMKAVVELVRDVRLSFRAEAALTGLGSTIDWIIRSRSGKPSTPGLHRLRNSLHLHNKSLPSNLRSARAREQLAEQSRTLEEKSQELEAYYQLINDFMKKR